MLRDTAREEGATKDFLSLPKKVLVTLNHFICSFFSTARRTNQEAPPLLSGFWLVATVAVGVCGTRFARTVLALFPPSSLRLHRPIKARILLVLLLVFSTPSPFGHSPYIPCRNTGGEGGPLLSPLRVFLRSLLVAMLLSSPLYFAVYPPQCCGARQGRSGIILNFRLALFPI